MRVDFDDPRQRLFCERCLVIEIGAVGIVCNFEEAAMNISSVNVSTNRPFNNVVTAPELLDEFEEGLNLLQKHRELLLQQAESLLESSIRTAGCLSEESIVECVHDSADYQIALKELGDLFKSSSDFIYAIEVENEHVALCIDHYEDEYSSETTIEAFTRDQAQLNDDDLEACGYFGWLAQ